MYTHINNTYTHFRPPKHTFPHANPDHWDYINLYSVLRSEENRYICGCCRESISMHDGLCGRWSPAYSNWKVITCLQQLEGDHLPTATGHSTHVRLLANTVEDLYKAVTHLQKPLCCVPASTKQQPIYKSPCVAYRPLQSSNPSTKAPVLRTGLCKAATHLQKPLCCVPTSTKQQPIYKSPCVAYRPLQSSKPSTKAPVLRTDLCKAANHLKKPLCCIPTSAKQQPIYRSPCVAYRPLQSSNPSKKAPVLCTDLCKAATHLKKPLCYVPRVSYYGVR